MLIGFQLSHCFWVEILFYVFSITQNMFLNTPGCIFCVFKGSIKFTFLLGVIIFKLKKKS